MNAYQLAPRRRSDRRTTGLIVTISVATIGLYIAVTVAGIAPVYLLPVAISAAGAMEYLLIKWATGRTTPDAQRTGSTDAVRHGRFERKSNIAGLALLGRRYSQQTLFEELRSMLVERASARNGIDARRLREVIAERGANDFFRNAVLAQLYERRFEENDGQNGKGLSGREFVERMSSIFECLEKY